MQSLEQLNPAMKSLTVVICVLILAIFYDPLTPLLFLIWTLSVTAILANIHWRKWVLFLSPFLLFAFGYFWTTMLFANSSSQSPVWWAWGWITVTEEGFYKGLSLGLRVLTFASLSFMFIFTTDPVRFIYALMQQWKLPPKLAYGILAGFRLMPTFLDELALMRKAHRIRGVDRARGVGERVKRLGRYLIPLLASAIRKAERAAMAMESKGFTGERKRTYYYDLKVTYGDWLFMGLMLTGILVCIGVSWKFGLLDIYRIQL